MEDNPARRFIAIATALVTFCATGVAQVEITSSDSGEAYIEMSTDELRSLVGKVQRLRIQRAKQYAYLRAQSEGESEETGSAVAAAPVYRAAAPNDDARLREMDRDINALSAQIAALRDEMREEAFRQNRQYARDTVYRATAPTAYRPSQPRDDYRRDDYRREGDPRRDEVDYRLRDERARYDRDLRDERDRYRRLERELDDLRRAGVASGTTAPRSLPYANPGPGLGFNNYRPIGGGFAVRDTVYVTQDGERVLVRDTIRDTRIVTRTVVEDRIDLAAVLFAHNSTVITPAAELQLAQAISAFRRQPSAQLLLRGFASRVGDVNYNQGLSSRRTEAVRDYLNGRGVPLDSIRLIANGEDPTDDFASGRRVEIQLLPRG